MNRELKFRCWAPCRKQMLPVVDLNQVRQYWPDGFGVHEILCMQFTGLKDKNGREIYEDDIVDDGVPPLQKVRFDDSIGAFLLGNNDHLSEDLEVVGNIYENSELLEVA